jgi:hypothetical protein
MPSRIKVAREPIIRMVAEVGGNEPEAARRLGLHYNTVHQIMRLHRGMCISCVQHPHQKGRTKCAKCAERERSRTANKRADARKLGKCSMCPKKLRKGSTLYCDEHYYQTFKRQKVHRVVGQYGYAALDVLNAANGQCQICGAKRDEARIDLHHIDENPANGAINNLIVICQSCHWITHRLILSRDRKALIAWFEKAYPDKPLR